LAGRHCSLNTVTGAVLDEPKPRVANPDPHWYGIAFSK